uniref:Septin n=1 Tax=Meloidogyne incognita TaxID=6306 RepID=A0A914KPR3_MELIC
MSLVHADSVIRPTKPPNVPSPKASHAPKAPLIQPITLSSSTTVTEKQQKTSSNATNNNNNRGLNGDANNNAEPELKLTGFVGFDSLPYQFVRRCQQNGFQFNLLCVGETGIGKTTLVESLFNMKMEFAPCDHELNTVELRTRVLDVAEGGVRVKLRVVETAGFGDQLDKEKSARVIIDYINSQFEGYLKEELKVKRNLTKFDDTRIHACLYLISPTGHGLKALDLLTLGELSKRVNVIPLIAKADTACKDELVRFKQKIISELKAHKIEIYQFPIEDETVRKENSALNALLPFAIVGSVDFVTKDDGRVVRARRYPWGMVEVENEEHCDFVRLREAILRTNQDSLREQTHNVLYERYRRERLRQMKMSDGDAGPKMMEAFAQRQKELLEEFQKSEEQHQKEFLLKVNKKEAELKHHEDMLNIRHNEIDSAYQHDLKMVEAQINSLLEEKAKLESKGKKRLK